MLFLNRIGYDCFPIDIISLCNHCNQMTMDSKALHCLSCFKGYTNVHDRHENLVHTFKRFADDSKIRSSINDYQVAPPHAADLHFFSTAPGQSSEVYDITVHNPYMISNHSDAFKGQSFFLNKQSEIKNKAIPGKAFINTLNNLFIPVVFDVHGNPGDGVHQLIKKISTRKASVNGYSSDSCLQRLFKTLQCKFAQYTAKMIWSRFCVIDNTPLSIIVPTPNFALPGVGQVSNVPLVPTPTLFNNNSSHSSLPSSFFPLVPNPTLSARVGQVSNLSLNINVKNLPQFFNNNSSHSSNGKK